MQSFDFHTHDLSSTGIWNLPSDETPNSVGYFSAGLHPWFLEENWKEQLQKVKTLSKQDNCLAIGECGFDRLRGPSISIQQAAFEAQAETAEELDIPIILHCVKAHDLVLAYLKNHKNPPSIIWHGWNLKPHLASQLLEFPVYFSFGKALLNANSNASNWLKACPSDRIFFETDDASLGIDSIYEAASLILVRPVENLRKQVVENWNQISSRKIK
ncbi:Mg-dependent DNase [Algoriphagus kandeliae]|uniref:Mg-dependent DNase n=1 Tax=Algoriphagus kandeliae TaxID=2562278 RepID=A0A4Y9QXP5_9BACT|nr:TatD family hydrolase [Algoriphagus kandeliae]TFV95976.1 Mg-dependent DNase [Algoriphagus kandeliae]